MKHFGWAFLWAIVVLGLCVVPPSDYQEVPRFEGMDKLVHTGFFFVFTILLYYGALRRGKRFVNSISLHSIVLFIALLFAGITEFLQWKVFTYRSAELWDLFADFVGIGMGVFAYLVLYLGNYLQKQSKEPI
jgi:VanZ family protein